MPHPNRCFIAPNRITSGIIAVLMCVSGHRLMIDETGAGCEVRDAGCGMQGAGFELRGAGCGLKRIDYFLLNILGNPSSINIERIH